MARRKRKPGLTSGGRKRTGARHKTQYVGLAQVFRHLTKEKRHRR